MHGPALLGWLLVALCGGTGLYCLWWARAGPAPQRRPAGLEGAMGLSMAAMAVPAPVLPPPPPLLFAAVFMVIFAIAAGAPPPVLRIRATHQAHHLIEALAMFYMSMAMTGHSGPGTGGEPLVTTALLGYFAVYGIHAGARLPAGPQLRRRPPAAGRQPEMATACRLALALGMVAMLLTL
ncbi:DUF5134 domain-containing protein [Streptomyces sp. ACA25]|nr:DUF5134 domain-containing protein [Streptomyces sp. ACA25]MDB1089305.1 DUF5134 domain-containing protein [Streptomyces sp. ACA25]